MTALLWIQIAFIAGVLSALFLVDATVGWIATAFIAFAIVDLIYVSEYWPSEED
jgi:hypothetical protein